MAERTGTTRGAVRPGFGEVRRGVGTPTPTTVPVPSGQSGSAATWAILARVGSDMSRDAHARYDKQVEIAGREAGVMDALAGNVRFLDRSTTRGGAYHDAAVSTMATVVETNALTATAEMYRQHADDPAALSEALDLYARGAVGEMARVSPEAAVSLQARMVRNAIPMINGAVENRERKMAAAVKAAREVAEDLEQQQIAAHSAGLFSADPEQSAASMAALTAARARVTRFQSEEASEGFLLNRLTNGHASAHIVNLQGTMKERLAAMISGAPEGIGEGLQIGSGFRSVERQRQLWEASDKTGRTVARPGSSQHNHGNAVDLYWNGQRLDKAPDHVRKWVSDNAGAFGLKLPMDYEPWHVEVQETRGGERFEPRVAAPGRSDDPDGVRPSAGPSDIFAAHDQAFYDQTIGTGFKAWWQSQTDRVGAYLDFVEGKIELPIHTPDGQVLSVNVRNRLSAKAAEEIDQDLRARLNFERSLRDDKEAADTKAAAERTAATRSVLMTHLLAPGQTFKHADGEWTTKLPTTKDIWDAYSRGDLDAADYQAMLKMVTVDRPATSNEDIKREAFRMVRSGIDPESFLLDNLGQITAADARTLLDYHQTVTEGGSALSTQQQFFFDRLKGTFDQGMLADFDEARNERMANALIEYRSRVLEGEEPAEVFEDVRTRAKLADTMSISIQVQSELRPRFSVADPADPARIDVRASAQSLQKAHTDGRLSDEEFRRQKELVLRWSRLQAELDRDAASMNGAQR